MKTSGLVHRHHRVTIKAQDIDGNDVKLRLKGYPAIVFQHEIDHLNLCFMIILMPMNL